MKTLCCILLLLFILCPLPTMALQQLSGHVPAVVSGLRLTPVGPMPPSTWMHFSIGLPFRNRELLTNLLNQVCDPRDRDFHRCISPSQFTDQFGPSVQDYEAVKTFARAHGLIVGPDDPGRLMVHVSGTVADIDRTFHIQLSYYQHPAEPRRFFSPDIEPSVDLATPVLCISGLNDYTRSEPCGEVQPAANAIGTGGGSGPLGSLLGNDFRAAYVPQVSLTGVGQTIGLLERDYYYTNDITTYETLAGLSTNIVIRSTFIDSGTNVPSAITNNVQEVSLDIEMAIAMAPGASVLVFAIGLPDDVNDALSAMANDTNVYQFSSSWTFSRDAMTDQLFQKLAMQSQSFFQASGDEDAYFKGITANYPHAGPPSDDPYVTVVGGTTLTTSGPGGFRISETAWNRFCSGDGTNGTGGGVSTNYPIPTWQTNVDMSLNGGSTSMRNIPDVAMPAEDVWVTFFNGLSEATGGTSCAAPLWAAFMALVNEQATNRDLPPIANLTQTLYRLAESPQYHALFHDITTGNNTNLINPDNVYYAVPGYDLCTGWGTPNGMNLINALTAADPLMISPADESFASGAPGGPFFPASETLQLTNLGATAINWSIGSLAPWLNASISGGVLSGPNGSASVALTLNPIAAKLTPGWYDGYVVVSNLTLHTGQRRDMFLQVGLNPLGFDDLPSSNSVGLRLSPGYAGLYWTNFFVLNGLDFTGNPSGYQAGAVTAPNVIFNGDINGNSASPAGIIGIAPFDLFSVYATAAWRSNLRFEAKGYSHGQLIYDSTNFLSSLYPTLLQYNYYGVDRVEFASSGGTTTPGYGGSGEEFVLDGLTVATHAAPVVSPSLSILATGGQNAVLNWGTQVGQTYQLQFKTNLTGAWNDIGSPVTATGAGLVMTNTLAVPQIFYRLQLMP